MNIYIYIHICIHKSLLGMMHPRSPPDFQEIHGRLRVPRAFRPHPAAHRPQQRPTEPPAGPGCRTPCRDTGETGGFTPPLTS